MGNPGRITNRKKLQIKNNITVNNKILSWLLKLKLVEFNILYSNS